MRAGTVVKFVELLNDAHRKPEGGKSNEEWALIVFHEFDDGVRSLMKEGLPGGMLALLGASLELQYKGAKSTEIKIGMLQLMVDLTELVFADQTDPIKLSKVSLKKADWRKEIDDLKARTAKLETLSMNDILNAPPLVGTPNN